MFLVLAFYEDSVSIQFDAVRCQPDWGGSKRMGFQMSSRSNFNRFRMLGALVYAHWVYSGRVHFKPTCRVRFLAFHRLLNAIVELSCTVLLDNPR